MTVASPSLPEHLKSQLSDLLQLEEGKRPPRFQPLLRKRPVLVRANFVLTKDRKRTYYGQFCGKMHREGSCSKAARGP